MVALVQLVRMFDCESKEQGSSPEVTQIAEVLELADMTVLETVAVKGVWVRLPLSAQPPHSLMDRTFGYEPNNACSIRAEGSIPAQ